MKNLAHNPASNRILVTLPSEVYEQLQPSLEQVTQTLKDVLQEPNVPMPYVYFPLSSVCSILVQLEDDNTVEVATVGNEGMVGLPVFFGSAMMPTLTIVQVPGEALRMTEPAFKKAVNHLEPLRDLLQHYTQAMFMLIAQTAACNREHSIEQRCARWLMMTHDRVGANQFSLTQEFLAQMLGVRRAGVNEVAGELQQEGLIQYSRGIITITDRAGLEARACECYRIVNEEFERSFKGA